MGADARRRVMAEALAQGLVKGMAEVLTPIFGQGSNSGLTGGVETENPGAVAGGETSVDG
jgi:hypothetical protein